MISNSRRVVVTGLGVVSSLGYQVKDVWKKLLEGECGITKLIDPDYEKNAVKIAATVSKETSGFIEEDWIAKMKNQDVLSSNILYSFAVASQALNDAELENSFGEKTELYGVSIGSVDISFRDVLDESNAFLTKSPPSRISPHLVSKLLLNTPAAIISKEFGFQGPNLVTSSACSASSQAIGEAFRLIRNGDANVMITGGSEACIHPVVISGFERIHALTTKYNENPKKASRPFDKDRSGFVVAEGAAALILEEYKHAKARNAKIYAEILGYGLAGDAYHITAPSEDGRGAIRCMKGALQDASLQPKDICYINAHATSTPIGDAVENRAIKTLFGNYARNLKVSSTKGSTGHLQAASGAIEAVFTTLAVKEGVAPPTLNLDGVSSESEFDMNYVANKPQELSACHGGKRIALSNSFGFGGTNSCLCIGEI